MSGSPYNIVGYTGRALVVTDRNGASHSVFTDVLQPYLDQMGIPYDLCGPDIPAEEIDWDRRPLIVLAHPGCLADRSASSAAIVRAVASGVGLVSFGEQLSPWTRSSEGAAASSLIAIRDLAHPICRLHGRDERRSHFILAREIEPLIAGFTEPLVKLGGEMLLSVAEPAGQGRVALWSTLEWGRGDALGPLSGMDDLVWRSLVWAARKPFVTRSLPPLLTMRVDDVSGFGGRMGGPSGLYWLRDAVELGWKPWLGLFLDDLTNETLDELRPMLRDGRATACPHAFSYWDFGYFRHLPKDAGQGYDAEILACEPLSAAEVQERAGRVEAWYAQHPEIPISKVFIPHYYELTDGFLPYLARWGCEFICSMNPENAPYQGRMTTGRPYYRKTPPAGTTTPVFYADWYPAADDRYRRSLFASLTEIRDDNGYEWAPNNRVDDTIRHGINQISRALDAQVLAQLFTHESGYIQFMKPDHWRAVLEAITETYAARGVIFATLDEAMAYLRDLHQSRLVHIGMDDGVLDLGFEGTSAGATKVAVYTDDSLEPIWKPVAPFRGPHRETIAFS